MRSLFEQPNGSDTSSNYIMKYTKIFTRCQEENMKAISPSAIMVQLITILNDPAVVPNLVDTRTYTLKQLTVIRHK